LPSSPACLVASLPSAATTESRLPIRGNLEDEFATFPGPGSRKLAISKPQQRQKRTPAQRLGQFFTDDYFVQASALPPRERETTIALPVQSFRSLSGDLATITHNTMAMAPSIERSPNSRSVVETSTGVARHLPTLLGIRRRNRWRAVKDATSTSRCPTTKSS